MHQHAGERQHPLLTARERPGDLLPPLTEAREQLERALESVGDATPPESAAEGQREVLLDRERAEHRAALGRVHDAERRDLPGLHAGDVIPGEQHLPGRDRDEARHNAGDRGLAGAVAAEQGRDLALLDRERDAEQRAERPVAGVDVAQLEQRCGRGRRCRSAGIAWLVVRAMADGRFRVGNLVCDGDLAEVRPSHRLVAHHLVGRALARSACRSRARRDALAKARTISTSCSTSRIAVSRVALDLVQRADELCGLVLVESRRRLVEQQQLRLGHQRPPDLDEAAPTEAERLDRAVGDVVETEQAQRPLGALALVCRSGSTG